MELHNTRSRYGVIAKTLHWLIAISIIAVWLVGYYAIDLPNKDPIKFKLFDLHKSVGMAILLLVTVRLTWRLYDGTPKSIAINKVLKTAANTVHFLLYVFMFLQPLSGWAMSSAAGYNPTFFGLFTFPGLVAKNPNSVDLYVAIHNASAAILLVLFVLHVGGALFHHFILKDLTLRRMTID